MITDLAMAEIHKEIEHFCGLGARVIDQSRRRVLNGEQVPTAEKIYSIFEPHTDLIKRGKVQTPIEFGHKVFLAESARGLITQYEVLDGNPVDEQHLVVSLERHKQTFGDVPKLYGSDRGFFSEKNVSSCKQEGVKVVCIPQRGGTTLSRRHRGAHLGVVPRSRHEALSRRGPRAFRVVGRGGPARQQPHEDCSVVDG